MPTTAPAAPVVTPPSVPTRKLPLIPPVTTGKNVRRFMALKGASLGFWVLGKSVASAR